MADNLQSGESRENVVPGADASTPTDVVLKLENQDVTRNVNSEYWGKSAKVIVEKNLLISHARGYFGVGMPG
jgi:hypothetical protein